MTDPQAIADRFTQVWNEPDSAVRRASVEQIWTSDAVEYADSVYRGHDALEARVAAAYEEFVAGGDDVFQLAEGSAALNHNALTFTINLVPRAGGEATWSGQVFLLLDESGHAYHDHQFTGADAETRGLVSEFLTRLAAGDPTQIAGLFAESVDWKLDWPEGGHSAVPWIRARTTRADVADHFRQLNTFHLADRRGGVEPTVLVDGTEAVILGEIRQTVRATGKPYVASFALRLTVRDGLITRYHVYEDSLTVANAFADAIPLDEP